MSTRYISDDRYELPDYVAFHDTTMHNNTQYPILYGMLALCGERGPSGKGALLACVNSDTVIVGTSGREVIQDSGCCYTIMMENRG